MITALVIGGVAVYLVASYAIVGHWLSSNPGPGALGWLAFPAAPLIVPVVGWEIFKAFMRRVFS